ncbi:MULTISPECIES: hypothetical protein [Brevibacillus]|uniref:hypothetical protein n=1 Tax=Brevibacillus TaxID=55080 RepID=UPI00156B6ACA|nr:MULTISPECIES: hypothetical protein [Brevibacillus]MDH6352662.1 hypothetical protein [Brevibacillus sp. 1238]MED2257979.1 hypothetical protein [Brevibacillus parabrevis]UED69602.1 hypothetical protein HP435_02730 [Brevibacillus sp. HD3.3A]
MGAGGGQREFQGKMPNTKSLLGLTFVVCFIGTLGVARKEAGEFDVSFKKKHENRLRLFLKKIAVCDSFMQKARCCLH